jgi:hypothetical protein
MLTCCYVTCCGYDTKYISLHLSNIAAVDQDSSRSHGKRTSRSRYRKNLAAFSLLIPRRSCRGMPSIVLVFRSASRDSIVRKMTEQSSTLSTLWFINDCTHDRVFTVPMTATRGAASAMRECIRASLRSNRHTIMTSRCCCIVGVYGLCVWSMRMVYAYGLCAWYMCVVYGRVLSLYLTPLSLSVYVTNRLVVFQKKICGTRIVL